jgi:hypothetical protein
VSRTLIVVPWAVTYLLNGYESLPHDMRIYAEWGKALAAGDGLPVGDDRWQYPPGAAVVLAVPAVAERLLGVPYPVGFVAGIVALDAAVTAVLVRRRSASAAALWAVGGWAVGQVMVTRFDVVPAGLAVVTLTAAASRRWALAGAALGAGAVVKVWPALLLPAFGLRRKPVGGTPASARGDPGGVAVDDHDHSARPGGQDAARRAADGSGDGRDGRDGRDYGDGGHGGTLTRLRDVLLLAAGLAAVAAGLVSVLVATGWWGDAGGFLGSQQARGLQLEAVPATPFVLGRLFGVGAAPAYEYGSMQFSSGAAQAVATACSLFGIGLVAVATAWWWGLRQARGPSAADRAFALLTLIVVTSRVLSPQYLIWLLAVAACRPAPWAVVAGTSAGSGGGSGVGADVGVGSNVGSGVGSSVGIGDGDGVGGRWLRRPAILLLVAAALSQLVYPVTYDGLVAGDIVPSLLLVARNAVLVALCAVSVRSTLTGIGRRPR